MTAVSAVVLAAGLSSRMGGPHKLLLDVGGEPMLRRVVRSVLGVDPAEVVVVTGFNAEAVVAALDGLPVRCVHNPAFADGQPGSVVAGMRALTVSCDAVMIVLGDQPLLTPGALGRLIEAYRNAPDGRSILVPTSGGERGNPVLFAARHIAAIGTGTMKVGDRRLIEAYPEQVALIEMADDAFTQDCDTPADYAMMQARLGIAS
ncbi:nucleotidyltransferase family protein [Acidisoma sp.]|uniref:nucleotidyltransferase family protein n=1 Tax=Acidisoma sp. TaxID=1872115 RepID=UPI003AFFF1A5